MGEVNKNPTDMVISYAGVLGQAHPSGGSWEKLYSLDWDVTNPGYVTLNSITVANTHPNLSDYFHLSVLPRNVFPASGTENNPDLTGLENQEYLYKNVDVANKDTFWNAAALTLGEGDDVYCRCESGFLSFTLAGFEYR